MPLLFWVCSSIDNIENRLAIVWHFCKNKSLVYYYTILAMTIYKRISAFFLISCSFACTAVLALGAVTISPMTLDIEPGESVSFNATPLGSSWAVTYEWYIDGLLLTGVTSDDLALNWTDYAALFPADITTDSTRAVTVVATDSIDTQTWVASLSVNHPLEVGTTSTKRRTIVWWDNYCGDGILRLELWEFCDDWNGKKWDGCTMNCECEDWRTCTVDETGRKSIIEKNVDPVADSAKSPSDKETKPKRSIIDILAEKNRDPLRLSEDAPLKAYMPHDAPQTWVSLEMLHAYNKVNNVQKSPDLSLLRPIAQKSAVDHPAILPVTGLEQRWFQPNRVTSL